MSDKTRIIFFGTPDFSVKTLETLISKPNFEVVAVVTQPDRAAGRGNKLTPSPVKNLALKHEIPVLQPERIKADISGFIDKLKQLEPIDIAIVIAFGQILPLKVLQFPRCGSVNIHASLLPRWRGAAPIQRAIMNMDKETGVCLMQMEKGLDTGAVFSTLTIPISAEDDFGSLHDKLAALGARLCDQDLLKIINGTIKAIPQSDSGVTYAEKIENDEAHIIWERNAEELSAQVRALSPVPGAFTYLDGKRLKIFSLRATSGWPGAEKYPAGTVIRSERSVLEVNCSAGSVALESVQFEGKKRMQIEEFLRGNTLKVGVQLR